MKGKIKAGALGVVDHCIPSEYRVKFLYADDFTKRWIMSLDLTASRNIWYYIILSMRNSFNWHKIRKVTSDVLYCAYKNGDDIVESELKMKIAESDVKFTLKIIPSSYEAVRPLYP
jgi:hypothetical protein